jgi:hypothetical protein
MKAMRSSETSFCFHGLQHCVISQMRGILNRKMDFGETGCEAVERIPRVENCADSAQISLVADCVMSSSTGRWLCQQ